jgi:hypothetical protein
MEVGDGACARAVNAAQAIKITVAARIARTRAA